MPSALTSIEFRKLIARYGQSSMQESSGLDEFVRILEILDSRKQQDARLNPPKLAGQDRMLYSHQSGAIDVKVSSLSPSDASNLAATLGFSSLLPTRGERKKRIPSLTPNQSSMVLWIEVAGWRLLLGADLEVTTDPTTGWLAILSGSTVVTGKAEVFKIPHHGAKTAHEPRVWLELLSSQPYAMLSPFNLGDSLLPTPDDVQRIAGLTPNGYITAPPIARRHKWSAKVVRETLHDATRAVHNVHCGWGQIRLRRSLADGSTPWRVELFGDATALKPDVWAN